ncbi:hypothetical protein EDB92DRAFT_1812540 [Lactarius akahatsu]|uniref:Ndc10 domain-containing protein n=1 Tax=Lactarius akahatsu TaxID=416441 RepID=A0AAD4LUK0_9AGAM|nr:hypothetical protein EDB92DRAFT_1812540 [Lactarius akahatsu]
MDANIDPRLQLQEPDRPLEPTSSADVNGSGTKARAAQEELPRDHCQLFPFRPAAADYNLEVLPVTGAKLQAVQEQLPRDHRRLPPFHMFKPHAGVWPHRPPAGQEGSLAADEDFVGALQDMASVESSYQKAINREPDSDGGEEDGEEEDEDRKGGEDPQEDGDAGSTADLAAAENNMAWVDTFIFNTRREGGRQTETSVLKTYKAWLPGALCGGTVPDVIVDANHMIHYLNTPTQQSLKKIVTMLGRIRRRQEDSNPDLVQSQPASNSRCQDYVKSIMVETRRLQIQSVNFDVTKVPSIVKSLFAWNWQLATLNCGDELVNLPLAFLQPYAIRVPDFDRSNGKSAGMNRGIFGKNEPTYNFVVPHRDPLRCPVGALVIMFHFMFDQGDLVGKIPGWDWANASSWCTVHLMFSQAVNKPMSGNSLCKMYKVFLDATSFSSMAWNRVSADHIEVVGHWVGNVGREVYGSKIPKQAVTALARFYVGETYRVPWVEVPVPGSLTKQVFPFVEEALATIRARGCQNQGTINFLELLWELWPFFWWAMAVINSQFPNTAVIKCIQVVHHLGAQQFFSQWLDAVCAANGVCNVDIQLSNKFCEDNT